MVTAANPGSLACLSVIIRAGMDRMLDRYGEYTWSEVLVVEGAGWSLFMIGRKIRVDPPLR
jgi:hypothetical protein